MAGLYKTIPKVALDTRDLPRVVIPVPGQVPVALMELPALLSVVGGSFSPSWTIPRDPSSMSNAPEPCP